jgi:photosystem II stability/assembly factor-like uncharacterized protein
MEKDKYLLRRRAMKISLESFQLDLANTIKRFSSIRVFVRKIFPVLILILLIYYLIPNILFAQQKKPQKLYDDLFSVIFSTEKDGWTCGRWGTILHTSDGGKTWVCQNSGVDYSLSSIFFVDSKHGWAVGDEGTIIHTQDGGKNWDKQKSPVSLVLMDVYFATPTKGWIVTEQTHILYTDNGGKTWGIQFKDKDFILKAISFCDQLNGWAVGEYGYIYHTKNGGITWEKQGGKFEISASTGEPEGGNILFDVVAIDPQTAWAVGIDSYVIKTVDGGKRWQEVQLGISKTHLFCVYADKAGTVLIGGKGTFLSSTDQGKNWQTPLFTPPITYGWIYGVSRCSDSSFVAVGKAGAVYFSSSTSWQGVSY